MNRVILYAAFMLGAAAIVWISAGFLASGNSLALVVTLVIGAVYLLGFVEMLQFRSATATLMTALQNLPPRLDSLDGWLSQVHASLQNAVRLRIEGERQPLPGPVFAPYLVGLLVMLGLLGTFIGMVVTLQGAVQALEGTTELQAIREGLTAPIKGLGLAFGTSVAGVAASAMLGLMSTLSRRERLQASGLLDSRIATMLRPFSLAHNRQETFKAMQFQAQALPELVNRLQDMSGQLQQSGQVLGDALLANQQSFQQGIQSAFTDLAQSVAVALQQHLADSTRQTTDVVRPLLSATLEEIAGAAKQTQQQLQAVAQQQAARMHESFEHTSRDVASAWQKSVGAVEQAQQKMLIELQQAMARTQIELQQKSVAVLDGVERSTVAWTEQQAAQDEERLTQWSQRFDALASSLLNRWQATGDASAEQQQRAASLLEQSAARIIAELQAATAVTVRESQTLLQSSSQQMAARQSAEDNWLQNMSTRSEQLIATLRTELAALRDAEAERGSAAVSRLAGLETAVTDHLARLGNALEAPMVRLIDIASKAPQAAAEVIEQMRANMSANLEHDNALLAERTHLLNELAALITQLNTSAGDQRRAVEDLVQSAGTLLDSVGKDITRQLASDSARLETAAAQLTGSSAEVASLGEAFGFAVELFRESNEKLIDSFQRIETALDKSASRNDEQLAYYVSQAREIIDLSMMSQKEVFEELRRIGRQTASATASATEVEEVC